ncbi:Histidine kinase [Catalinimonas alkaloidigena]|uniref:Histidine kinase n=1 Tax=Catalinimonas alkaloidigena TaxID=1075417 RepID=A0A1G9AWX3_9BACT|nr:histidine kinase [Catalinimonas alkaloidigena]SDK31733.1 Histidine kinase [Catalinimonas alkaloidigena]
MSTYTHRFTHFFSADRLKVLSKNWGEPQTVAHIRRTELSLGILFLVTQLVRSYQKALDAHQSLFQKVLIEAPEQVDFYLSRYSYFWNGFLPALFFWVTLMGAWWAMHYYIVPTLVERQHAYRAFLVATGVVGWLLLGTAASALFDKNAYWNDQQLSVEVWDVTFFQALDRIAIILVTVVLYELIAQLLYGLHRLVGRRTKKESRRNMFQQLIAALFFWAGLLLAFLGDMPLLPPLAIGLIAFSLPAWFLCYLILLYGILPRVEIEQRWLWLVIYCLPITLLINFLGAVFFSEVNDVHSNLAAIWMLHWAVSVSVVVVIAWLAYGRRLEQLALMQEVAQGSAELSSLKAQLNPHFLFNALNTLYASAIQEESERTAEGIQKLGDMMRFMLHDNEQDRVTLARELEYLNHYIELQKLRIGEHPQIDIQLQLPETECHEPIAPMLLMPFVENAFKHGISLQRPSWIYVELTCAPKCIRLIVQNSCHERCKADDPARMDPEREASGVGLDNVKKRLQLLYPDRHTLDIHQTRREFSVHLELRTK